MIRSHTGHSTYSYRPAMGKNTAIAQNMQSIATAALFNIISFLRSNKVVCTHSADIHIHLPQSSQRSRRSRLVRRFCTLLSFFAPPWEVQRIKPIFASVETNKTNQSLSPFLLVAIPSAHFACFANAGIIFARQRAACRRFFHIYHLFSTSAPQNRTPSISPRLTLD